MKIPIIDYSLLKIQLIIFLASAVCTGILAFWANGIIGNTNQAFSQIEQKVSSTSEQLHHRLEGIEIYNNIHQQYLALYGADYQKPDKLHWMEQLQKQAEQLQLTSLTYNIKARTEDQALGSALTEDFTVFSTAIEFKAGLVHDAELLQFIDRLKSVGLDQFSVEQCQLALVQQQAVFLSGKANISAQCLLEWYEIERKKTDEPTFDPGVIL